MIILCHALPVCALLTSPNHGYADAFPGIAVIPSFQGVVTCDVVEGRGVRMEAERMVPGYSVAHFCLPCRLVWLGDFMKVRIELNGLSTDLLCGLGFILHLIKRDINILPGFLLGISA